MQCARCAEPLPAGALFCAACGLPVAINNAPPAGESASIQPAGAAPESAGHGDATPASADFAFQEFNGAPAYFPPDGVPGVPGQTSPYPLPPVPVSPGQPYAFSPVPVLPGQAPYPPFAVPGAPVPAQPKRRGRSMGCIVLYALLAILLVFVGLGVALYAIGSHMFASGQANQAAALRLYQQVTSQAPTSTDSLTDAAQSEWHPYQRATYGCSIEPDGLHVHVTDANHFAYCLDAVIYANFAFQVQMSMLSGGGGGLLFRMDGATRDFYFFQISPVGVYSVFLEKNSAAAPKTLASGLVQATSLQINQTSTLTVIVKGSTFDFYIAQRFIVQVQDATLQNAGYIGVISYDQTSSAEAVYTNAKIWDLDS